MPISKAYHSLRARHYSPSRCAKQILSANESKFQLTSKAKRISDFVYAFSANFFVELRGDLTGLTLSIDPEKTIRNSSTLLSKVQQL